jgi:hypothetical protein
MGRKLPMYVIASPFSKVRGESDHYLLEEFTEMTVRANGSEMRSHPRECLTVRHSLASSGRELPSLVCTVPIAFPLPMLPRRDRILPNTKA